MADQDWRTFVCEKCSRRVQMDRADVTTEHHPYAEGSIAVGGGVPLACPFHEGSTYYLQEVRHGT